MQRCPQQVAGRNESAVRDGVEERLGPVPNRMHSDREPQVAGAAQAESEKQTNGSCSQRANPVLARIAVVHIAKNQRGHEGSRPETDGPTEREQQVSAKGEFLV